MARPNRKLTISVETVRELHPAEVRIAGGGELTGTETITCPIIDATCFCTHTCAGGICDLTNQPRCF
jgi:hypothetical protein